MATEAFQSALDFVVGSNPNSVGIGYLNGDDGLDLALAGNGDSVSVLTGNGDGTFQSAVNYGSSGSWPNSVAIGDLDGDGDQDLAVANSWSDNVSILINTGTCNGVLNLIIKNQILSTTETFEACNTITAGPTVTVTSTGDVTFKAGKKVILKPGFLVQCGGRLSVVIDPSTGSLP